MGIKKNYYIIDFDSTFVKKEGLEVLAEVALEGNPKKMPILAQIKKITAAGMEGRLSFKESLSRRLRLIKANEYHVGQTADLIKNKITLSFWRNKNFIKKNGGRIYIISGAFRELITPTISLFDIAPNHILANNFIYNQNGEIVGCDEKNPLTQTGGKAKAVASLHLRGVVWAVGDGYTDYEIKKRGAADYFVAYTENVKRPSVVNNADFEVKNFNQLLNLFSN